MEEEQRKFAQEALHDLELFIQNELDFCSCNYNHRSQIRHLVFTTVMKAIIESSKSLEVE